MPTIAQWTARVTGDGVSYYPPDGRSVGGARIWERLRPLRPVHEIVRRELQTMRAIIRDPKLGPIEELRNDDGEHAALQVVTGVGTMDQAPVMYVFGFVFGDDYYNRIDGWMTDASRFGELDEVVRSAIRSNRLCAGTGRHRRFWYEPPIGWQGLARGPHLTEWYPRDFPKHHSRISVLSAFTIKEGSALVEALMSRRLMGFVTSDMPVRESIRLASGLAGIVEEHMGSFPDSNELLFTSIVHVALKDPKYTYVMRMDSTAVHLDEDRHVLMRVLKSVRPIPAVGVKPQAMQYVID